MKILLTGGAGFIGYHLAKILSKENVEVLLIDNLNQYYDIDLKLGRLKDLGFSVTDSKPFESQSALYKNLKFNKCDLKEKNKLREIFLNDEYDVVCNLAAQAGVRYSIENPDSYIDSNILGFHNLLECCREAKIDSLVYASSSSVYGMSNKLPLSESDSTDLPVSLYASTKKSNEHMAFSYSKLYGIRSIGLRFFTVYGPWGRPDMAYYSFTRAAYNDEKIKLYNKGKMKRDFTYISDITEGIKKALFLSKNNAFWDIDKTDRPYGNIYRLYNLGNNNPSELKDLISYIEKYTNKKLDKELIEMQPGDVLQTFADISLAKNDLNFNPQVQLYEGMENFVNWYKNFYDLNGT